MRVYGSNGKRCILFDEEETSFSEAKSDSESLTATHDQTMVEGQVSSDNLKRGKFNLLGNSQIPAEYAYENKVDIFTELNILREDVKNSIEDVHTKMHAFDGKINHVLDLLQKVTFDQSEIKKRVNESVEINTASKEETDVNQNETVKGEEGSDVSKKKMNAKKQSKASKEGGNIAETFFMAQEPGASSQNAEKKKAKGDGSSKKDASTEGRSQKKEGGKEDLNVKKESNKDKQGGNKVVPEKEAGSKTSRWKQSRMVMKQPKQRPVVDDLDELERELEEIGLPNEGYKQPTTKTGGNSRTAKT